MTSVISKKLGYSVAQQFKEGFYEPSPTVGYVYIGNHLVYQDENNPSSTTDSIKDEKTVWDNMIAAKKITGTDVELVVPRINWTANTKYKQHDDAISVSELITACAATYNVTSITANSRAVTRNTYVTFTGGGTSNISANAQIYVNTAGYIVNVVITSNGSYTSAPTANIPTLYNVRTITANTGSTGANGYVIFTGGGSYVTPANARIYVNSRNYIINVVVIANGSYTSVPTATVNTGNGVLTVTTNTVFTNALLTVTTNTITPYVKPMYMITSSRNVYKCLSNNASADSTVEPVGDYTTSNGNISTSDGYIWKYMYNVKPSNKFLTDTWIPIPSSVKQIDYSSSILNVIDGEISTIVVANSGSGYYESNISIPFTFQTGCTVLTLSGTDIISGNISIQSANMSVSGVGITPGSYISAIDIPNAKLTLSIPTVNPGGGGTVANTLSLTTRVYVDGDGTTLSGYATLGTNGSISKVTVTTIGLGYSRANAYIYGTGTGALVRPILDPKYGHAYNPAKELGCSNVMVAVKIGEIDSTENGIISANTTFRQYGILVDPHKYGSSDVVTPTNANSVISQTTDLQLQGGFTYGLDEFVYQGTSATSAYAYGFVLDQTSNIIRLTNVQGKFAIGSPLVGVNTGTSRLIVSSGNPEYQPYSGDILYTENAVKTTRADGQAESIKLVVKF
jgi:hypothetical protein